MDDKPNNVTSLADHAKKKLENHPDPLSGDPFEEALQKLEGMLEDLEGKPQICYMVHFHGPHGDCRSMPAYGRSWDEAKQNLMGMAMLGMVESETPMEKIDE